MRVGAPPRVLGLLLTLALVSAVAVAWVRVARHGAPAGLAEVVVVGASLVFSTLLSAQFIVWLLPFVAIAVASGVQRLERWAALASTATFAYWWLYDPRHSGALNVELAIATRNVAVIGLVVVAARELFASRGAPRRPVAKPGDRPGRTPTTVG